MPSLNNVLKEIKRELREKEKVKEKAQKSMRKATSLSKQAILLIHQKRLKEAEKTIKKVNEIILNLKETSNTYPDIIYSGLFDATMQEYSEASILLSLVEEGRFITPSEIKVSSVDFVLGLADVIGEYRRMALDALREGNVEESEKCLRMMDYIYNELMAMDDA
ncbi:MAG: hypothetical protein QXE06_09740, partial [Candidatus Bathyarchaeia archaeon]